MFWNQTWLKHGQRQKRHKGLSRSLENLQKKNPSCKVLLFILTFNYVSDLKTNELIKVLAYTRLFSWYLCLIWYNWISSQIKRLGSCLPIAAEILKFPDTNTASRIRHFSSNQREILQTDQPILSFSHKFWWLRASPSKSHQETDADWIINPILMPVLLLFFFFLPSIFILLMSFLLSSKCFFYRVQWHGTPNKCTCDLT